MGYWTKKFNNTWFGSAVQHVSDFMDWSRDTSSTAHDWAYNQGTGVIGPQATGVIENLTGKTAQDNYLNELEREDTRYQRLMSDLAAAGLNPSSVFGSSGGAIPSNGVSGSVGSNLGAIGQILASGASAYLAPSQKENNNASAAEKTQDAIGKSLDNSIKAKYGVLQAAASLRETTLKNEAANAGIVETWQRYKKLYEETKTAKTESEISDIKKKLLNGEYDERAETYNFSGATITMSEAQLFSGKLGANLGNVAKKLGFDVSSELSQSTSVDVPIGVVSAALKGDEKACEQLIWYLTEDIGDKIKVIKKINK